MFYAKRIFLCRFALTALVATWLAATALSARPALGQAAGNKFEPLPISVDIAEIKGLERAKNRVLAGASYSDNSAEVDKWYLGYFFRSFTLPEEFGKLPAKRKELLSDLARGDRYPAFRNKLMADTVKYMQLFVNNGNGRVPIHPAVRFNAMLIIGELNAVEKTSSASKIPVPRAESLPFMLAEYGNKTQIDAVRVAALLGMLRHARLDYAAQRLQNAEGRMNPQHARQIAQEMVKLLNQTDPPPARNRQAHLWMQRRAVDVLAALGTVGQLNDASQAIDRIVASSEAEIDLRCTAAAALELLHPETKQVNIADTSIKLGALAAEASRHGLDWIDEFKRKKAAAEQTAPGADGYTGLVSTSGQQLDENNAAMMMGVEIEVEEMDESTGFDGMTGGADPFGVSGAEENPEVTVARRLFLSKLYCVQKGLKGLETAAADPQDKAQVDLVMAQLKKLLLATTPPKDQPDLDGLQKNMRKAVREMERLTRRATPAKAPAVGAAGAPGIPTGG